MAIEEVTISGRSFPNPFTLPARTFFGDIIVDVNFEETHEDRLDITRNPVEAGAPITDHSYKLPVEAVLSCGWSNSSLAALQGIVSGLYDGGTMSAADYVSGVYSQLLNLQKTRQPFSVQTSLRVYDNMLFSSLRVRRDPATFQALMVTATITEVILVQTETSSLPPQENQATPSKTAEVQNQGGQSVIAATPAPGGSVPQSTWGTSLISR